MIGRLLRNQGTRRRQGRELEFEYNCSQLLTKQSKKKKKKAYSVKKKKNLSRFPANIQGREQRVTFQNTSAISLIRFVMLHMPFPKPSNSFSQLLPKRGFSSNSITEPTPK